ncbi:MAG: DNA adenine methylase [Bifidobacterium choerinum]
MTKYGLPYRGSKNSIAEWVIDHLPPADTLVDLMAGGCAVSHAALMSGKYKHVIANDITDTAFIFDAAMRGEMDGYATVLTRDEFHTVKATDTLGSIIYSFSNNREDYLYGADSEQLKTAATSMILAPSIHERRLAYKRFLTMLDNHIRANGGVKNNWRSLDPVERLERVQALSQIDTQATFTPLQGDYRNVDIPADAIVYVDPPYLGTNCGAYNGFDFDAFYAWLRTVPNLTIISEYTAPPECVEITHTQKRVTVAANNKTKKATELLLVPARQLDQYKQAMGLLY